MMEKMEKEKQKKKNQNSGILSVMILMK